jgi:hypothetical protein
MTKTVGVIGAGIEVLHYQSTSKSGFKVTIFEKIVTQEVN